MKTKRSAEAVTNIIFVTLGMLLMLSGLFLIGRPFTWNGYTEESSIWLPDKYELANKLPNGKYGFPNIFSSDGSLTLVELSLEDFKSVVNKGTNTQIILKEYMHQAEYKTDIGGFRYYAWGPTVDRSAANLRVQEIRFISDSIIRVTYTNYSGMMAAYIGGGAILIIVGAACAFFSNENHKNILLVRQYSSQSN